ncbi:MAG: HEAT repeat domain-containing protein [Actinomycetota bacterium]|nr:HEAT repeat domain-containing protein [Actinomycetota bacterium]
MNLAEAVARGAELSDERALAELRREVADDIEAAARSPNFQLRAVAYRAIGQLRFNQKTELLRRGLEDESPACRGSALISLERLSREQPGLVNAVRPLLHTLAYSDAHQSVRRLAVFCLKNGSPNRETLTLLAHLVHEAEEKDLRATASSVHRVLRRKAGPR